MSSETDEHSNKNVFIVKGRFKSSPVNIFGQLLIIFTSDKKLESFNAVISKSSDAYNLEPHTSYNSFAKNIAYLRFKGNFDINMTSSLMNQLTETSENFNSVAQLYTFAYNYDYNNLDVTLYEYINMIIHDKDLILETAIQEISPDEYNKIIEDSKPKDSQEDRSGTSDKTTEKDTVILSASAILAPIKGKPLFDLVVGDILMVKIQPISDTSNYFIDLLNLRDDKRQIKPVPAKVIDIKAGTGKNAPNEILTEISQGIFGKILEDETQVKLRTYNPAIDGKLIHDQKKTGGNAASEGLSEGLTDKEDKSSIKSLKGTFIMIILFILMVTLFILLIMI